MSKMGDILSEWLNDGGYDLGYSELDPPYIGHMQEILLHSIPVWEYNGMTEKQYYSWAKNTGGYDG